MKVLTPQQLLAITHLSTSPLAKKFYWTGGTLLSLKYLHHRLSQDLDFFTDQSFTFSEIDNFVKNLQIKGNFTKVEYQKIHDRWEFLLKNQENLRIEFVYYNHQKKTIKKRQRFLGVYIDSLDDIAANKVISLIDRSEPKDLFDVYYLLTKKHYTADNLLKLCQKKFDILFTKDLFWSESLKTLPLLSSLKPLILTKNKDLLIRKIQEYFRSESNKFLHRIIE